MIPRHVFLSGTAALLASAATPALAQPGQAAGPPPADSGAAPTAAPATATPTADGENIVITARRRTENLQEVPLAVSVIGSAQLDASGSVNVLRLTQIQPSLQYYSSNPRNSAANIRGLGAPFGLTNDGIEQGVGIYIDQVYYSRIAVTTFDFLDVEQIEVLRGPQGTLYGKNTTAGAINITTRAPSFDFEGRGQVTIGNLDYVNAGVSLSGPIVADTLAFRVAASRSHRRGTIFNVTSDRWVNEQDNLGLRGSLLWRVADNFDLTLSADYNR